MDTTPSQGIPFPSGDDFGNGALDLQFLAQTVDANMFAKEAALRTILYPDVKILAGAPATPINSGVTTLISWGSTVLNRGFSNSTTVQLRDNGTYMMGCFIEAQPGAVTANSFRSVRMSVQLPVFPDPISGLVTQSATNSIIEPGAGNSFLTTQLIFEYEAVQGILAQPPRTTFLHSNVASSMALQSTSYFWIIRLSDLGN